MAKEKKLGENEATEVLNKKTEADPDITLTVMSHVGDMGRYQKLLFLGMMPFGFAFAFIYFAQMFIAATPQNHWCRVPELANLSMEVRRNLSAPITASGELERCMTFNTNWTRVLETLTPPSANTPMIPCQHGWEFELYDIPYETVVSERGWVCDFASYVPTAQSMFFVGSFFGGALLGWVADKYGRVPAFIGANMIGGIAGIATTFTTGVWDFYMCRFFCGMAYDNCVMMYYILILEYVGPQHRTWVSMMLIAFYFGSGCLVIPWVALWIGDWRKFVWFTSMPMFLAILAPWLMPESASWLVSKGKVNKAVKILRRFEKVNGSKIPDEVMDEFIIASNKGSTEGESLLALFKSPLLRKAMIIMVLIYMGCSIVFDGLVRLSSSFGLDFFIAFTFTSATEIPSVLLLGFLLDKWGRRNLGWGPLAMTTVLIFVAMFVPKGIPQAVLAIAARFLINMSYTVAMQWGTELLPTGFRASGLSLLHMSGYVAVIVSPFMVYSERYWSVLPLLSISVISFLTATFCLLLPETKGQPMPQTVADGEKLIREQSLCGKPEGTGEEAYKKAEII